MKCPTCGGSGSVPDSQGPDIIQGIPAPLLILQDPMGREIWITDWIELPAKVMEAIGPIPRPPAFGMGGFMKVVGMDQLAHGIAPKLAYNPGNDVINAALPAEFQTEKDGWEARAKIVIDLVVAARK